MTMTTSAMVSSNSNFTSSTEDLMLVVRIRQDVHLDAGGQRGLELRQERS